METSRTPPYGQYLATETSNQPIVPSGCPLQPTRWQCCNLWHYSNHEQYHRNVNIRSGVNDFTAHAQKHDVHVTSILLYKCRLCRFTCANNYVQCSARYSQPLRLVPFHSHYQKYCYKYTYPFSPIIFMYCCLDVTATEQLLQWSRRTAALCQRFHTRMWQSHGCFAQQTTYQGILPLLPFLRRGGILGRRGVSENNSHFSLVPAICQYFV